MNIDSLMHLADNFASLHRHSTDSESGKAREVLEAELREALSVVNQQLTPAEPVAWMFFFEDGDYSDEVFPTKASGDKWMKSPDCEWAGYIAPLYASPQPQREPLDESVIWQLVNDCTYGGDLHADKFARAVEMAHGIGVAK